MEDVTGFNQKSQDYDGEKLVVAGVGHLKDRFGENICKVFNLMLKFYEKDRPSFIELHRVMMKIPDFAMHETESTPIINRQMGHQVEGL